LAQIFAQKAQNSSNSLDVRSGDEAEFRTVLAFNVANPGRDKLALYEFEDGVIVRARAIRGRSKEMVESLCSAIVAVDSAAWECRCTRNCASLAAFALFHCRALKSQRIYPNLFCHCRSATNAGRF
jgi:hypothetical protein